MCSFVGLKPTKATVNLNCNSVWEQERTHKINVDSTKSGKSVEIKKNLAMARLAGLVLAPIRSVLNSHLSYVYLTLMYGSQWGSLAAAHSS